MIIGNSRTKQPNLVTVAVDKIQQARGDLKADADLVLFGQIAYTGSSSMDILMKIFRARDVPAEQQKEGEGEGEGSSHNSDSSGIREGMPEVLDGDDSGAILTSVYTFVARDGRGGCCGCVRPSHRHCVFCIMIYIFIIEISPRSTLFHVSFIN